MIILHNSRVYDKEILYDTNPISRSAFVRPPDIVCRRTYIVPAFLLLSFLRRLKGTQRKSATWSEVSVIWKRMSNICDTPPPTNRGPQNHFFGSTLQPNSEFNGLYLRTETWYRQSVKCVDNYKGSPTSSQNLMNFGPQTASNSTAIFTHPS